MNVKRSEIVLKPDYKRVLFQPFTHYGENRTLKIIARIMSLPEQMVKKELKQVLSEFKNRHYKLQQFFLKRFNQLQEFLITDQVLSEQRKMLIGAYFTREYSLESAALFNPSIVWHPNQSNLPEGCHRFIVSLRATGEGHISSITFRSGIIDKDNTIVIDEPSPYVTTPEVHPNPSYKKALFEKKLIELELDNDFSLRILAGLEEYFTLNDLEENITYILRQSRSKDGENKRVAQGLLSLATSNYEISYSAKQDISERIIFPYSSTERNGIEDARFVEFHDENNQVKYYATYTAYDGQVIFPQLLETEDFVNFKISTLNGPEVQNKGMALFPRKINGLYAMISRQDNENIYIMFSEQIHFWHSKINILKPTYPWEFVQLGNCGSPIETKAGWLVLSHGVGPMRKYVMGAFLLDLDDTTKVIGRLKDPLLIPNEKERDGYVPNVVYSCGSLIHENELIIPYAMSDYASTFATVNLDELLNELTA
jgi:predicted GH43/DUF377 family glycosyl hydrolase